MTATGAIVVLVTLAFGRLAYGLLMPFMRDDLHISYQQAGNLGTANALGYLCLITLSGVVAARKGGHRVVLIGLLFTTLGCIGLCLGSNYFLLLSCMVLLGFGTAFSYTPVISLLVGWFPEKRAAVIGALNSGGGIGMVIAGALVPYLNESLGAGGWRMTWAVFAVAAALTAAAAYKFLSDVPQAVTNTATTPANAMRSIYRNRYIIKTGFIYAVVGSMYVVQAIFMYSFALHAGLKPETAGRLAAMSGILTIFSGPIGGWLADRFGLGKVTSGLIAVDLVATTLPVLWPNLWGFTFHYLIIGAVMSALFSVILASTTKAVSAQESPMAVSYVTLFYAVAQFICPALAGLIIDKAGGFAAAFSASSALIGIALLLSLWKKKSA
jgi:MFS family permease